MRVLVVDDAVVSRKLVTDALTGLPEVEVVGSAGGGRMALLRIRDLQPDVVTLDIEMPDMNGLDVLRELRTAGLTADVIVISALSRTGGDLTVKALSLGAFDFVTKPTDANFAASCERLRQDLAPRLQAWRQRREIRQILRAAPTPSPKPVASPPAAPPLPPPARTVPPVPGPSATPLPFVRPSARIGRPELLLIGTSTGGPNALAELLPALPADLGLPVLIVQHMPPLFTASLAASLNGKCRLTVKEAEDGEALVANTVYIAPGGRQMKLAAPEATGQRMLKLTDDPPEHGCRPSVDYLFRSVALHSPPPLIAVILTGMGNDGAHGLRLLKRGACLAVAQDEASCVVYGMPGEAVKTGLVDAVLPLDEIAAQLVRWIGCRYA